MKKSIFAVFLMAAVCVCASSAAHAQRRTVRKATTTRTTVKKSVVKKTPVKPAVRQEAVTTASGLTYIITKKGDGAPIKKGDQVIVNYTGLLTNGKKFDSSFDRNQPFSFFVGEGRVIRGWDEGLQLLRVGDHATLIIPSSIGYGDIGAGNIIPGGATLIFIIEVLGVK